MQQFKSGLRYSSVLLKQLVKTDFKLRYKSSMLGYIWSLLKPLFLFGILYVVFVKIVKVDYGVPHSGIYLLLGIVLWTFFAELTGGAVGSVVGKGDLLRKISFPKYVIVLSTALSALINLILNLIIVAIFMIIAGVDVSWEFILVPLLLVELFVFSLGVGFFLATTYVRLRDVGYIWDVCMQALFYATPILFPVSFAPLWLQKVLILNPIAQIVQDLRYILVSKDVTTISQVYSDNTYMRVVPIFFVVLVFIFSVVYFTKQSPTFAEEI